MLHFLQVSVTFTSHSHELFNKLNYNYYIKPRKYFEYLKPGVGVHSEPRVGIYLFFFCSFVLFCWIDWNSKNLKPSSLYPRDLWLEQIPCLKSHIALVKKYRPVFLSRNSTSNFLKCLFSSEDEKNKFHKWDTLQKTHHKLICEHIYCKTMFFFFLQVK